MFESALLPGELIIDDNSGDDVTCVPGDKSTGLKLGLRSTPFGQIKNAPAFPKELLIPRSEWQARIQEMEERKSRTSDLCIAAGLPCKDQSSTNFCWANAPVHCLEIVRLQQGQPMVILSPASVGGPIKHFKNVGGWGEEALEWIVEHGACPVDQWPANAIDDDYYTEANKATAKDYRVTEWWELTPRNTDELISCLLRRLPVACGYNWQGHETTAVDAVWKNGQIGTRNRNSWSMDWPSAGAGGWYILQGQKMLADDAVCPRVAVAI